MRPLVGRALHAAEFWFARCATYTIVDIDVYSVHPRPRNLYCHGMLSNGVCSGGTAHAGTSSAGKSISMEPYDMFKLM